MKFPPLGPCEEMAQYRTLVRTTMCVPPGEDGKDHRGEDYTEFPDSEVASLCDTPPPPSARKQGSNTVFKMCPGFSNTEKSTLLVLE